MGHHSFIEGAGPHMIILHIPEEASILKLVLIPAWEEESNLRPIMAAQSLN